MGKNIYVSGYFSLWSLIKKLYEAGYNCCTSYSVPESVAPVLTINADTYAGLEHELREKAVALGGNRLVLDMAANITFGGRPLGYSQGTFDYIASSFVNSYVTIGVERQYINDIFDKGCDAVVVHNDTDERYGTVVLEARNRGIPSFCIYNGFSAFGTPRISGVRAFMISDYNCYYGDYILEYLKDRERSPIGKVTGNPGWDMYYNVEVEREPDVYLYASTLSFIHPSYVAEDFPPTPSTFHPWSYFLRPRYMDAVVMKAFAKFQETNPNAKLVIALRPYSGLKDVYEMYLEKCGVTNFTVYNHEDRPFRKLVLETSYMLSGTSTTILEGIITRTPTIYLAGAKIITDFFRGRDCYVETEINTKAVLNALEKISDDDVREKLVGNCNARASYWNYGDDGNATERVMEYIMSVLKEG